MTAQPIAELPDDLGDFTATKRLIPISMLATMRRSILTEKVARRGFHVSREYAIDPLEVLFVRDVMQTTVVGLPSGASVHDIEKLLESTLGELEPLYPVLEEDRLIGVVSRRSLRNWAAKASRDGSHRVRDIAKTDAVTAYADEPLRTVVQRMAETGRTLLPVVGREENSRLLGLIALTHALKARRRHLEEERRRERVLELGVVFPSVLRAFRPGVRARRARTANPTAHSKDARS